MLTINQEDNKYFVSFNNVSKLNIINSLEIENQLLDLTNKQGYSLILNLSEIKFIDSSGFESLLKVYRSAKMNNTSLKFTNVSSEAIELLKLVELDKVFERFYRPANSPGNGCGLGLAIIKEIADLHQAQIHLTRVNAQGGLRVMVSFPSQPINCYDAVAT